MTNKKRYGDVVLKNADHAVTFGVMRKAVKLGDDKIRMSSAELYQRLLSNACIKVPLKPDIFTYELSATAPALFNDDGPKRKTQKLHLANDIIGLSQDIVCSQKIIPSATVFDCCALIHHLTWPKIGTLDEVCKEYVKVVSQSSDKPEICVVFDIYNKQTSKDQEQK